MMKMTENKIFEFVLIASNDAEAMRSVAFNVVVMMMMMIASNDAEAMRSVANNAVMMMK